MLPVTPDLILHFFCISGVDLAFFCISGHDLAFVLHVASSVIPEMYFLRTCHAIFCIFLAAFSRSFSAFFCSLLASYLPS